LKNILGVGVLAFGSGPYFENYFRCRGSGLLGLALTLKNILGVGVLVFGLSLFVCCAIWAQAVCLFWLAFVGAGHGLC
jgi:hypothetical protein